MITTDRQLHFETEDRISARHREEALAAAGVHDKTTLHLAYLLTLGGIKFTGSHIYDLSTENRTKKLHRRFSAEC